jgi:glucokinase
MTQQLLAGDIGGTKTILRLVQSTAQSEQDSLSQAKNFDVLFEERYASGDFSDLVPMVQTFLKAAQAEVDAVEPRTACFAIAGPVTHNRSQLTNLAWMLSGERLATELHLKQVELINDFEAIGYGVLGLTETDIHTLQSGQPDPQSPLAILGAGTGLGQGFVINLGNRHRVFPSEGGHTDFAPQSEIEFQLLRYLLDKHAITRISVERVVSGQGIVSIYQFLRDRNFATESEALAKIIKTWEQKAGQRSQIPDPAAAISQAAKQNTDILAVKTMELFISAYGAEAGNLALKLLPYGGLYVAGGVAAKNLDLLKAGGFLRAFSDKGRVSHLLEQVPVHIITNQSVGLIGASIRAAQL